MTTMDRFFKKLAILFDRKRFRNELDEEMAFHREQAEKELIASGMTPEAARYAASRRFGNSTRFSERSHEVVGFRAESVLQDLRFALRQMIKNPGYALIAVVVLALGMGVSVAIFGFVDAALLEPLPYPNSNRLMAVDESGELFPHSNLSYDDYQDWKRLNKTLSSLDVYTGMGYLLRSSSGSEPVPAARVSDGFFSTLGVHMMLGRGFLPGEDRPAHPLDPAPLVQSASRTAAAGLGLAVLAVWRWAGGPVAPGRIKAQRVDHRGQAAAQPGRHDQVKQGKSVGRRIQVVLAAAHQRAQPVRRDHLIRAVPRCRPDRLSRPGRPDQHDQCRIGKHRRRPRVRQIHTPSLADPHIVRSWVYCYA